MVNKNIFDNIAALLYFRGQLIINLFFSAKVIIKIKLPCKNKKNNNTHLFFVLKKLITKQKENIIRIIKQEKVVKILRRFYDTHVLKKCVYLPPLKIGIL